MRSSLLFRDRLINNLIYIGYPVAFIIVISLPYCVSRGHRRHRHWPGPAHTRVRPARLLHPADASESGKASEVPTLRLVDHCDNDATSCDI